MEELCKQYEKGAYSTQITFTGDAYIARAYTRGVLQGEYTYTDKDAACRAAMVWCGI